MIYDEILSKSRSIRLSEQDFALAKRVGTELANAPRTGRNSSNTRLRDPNGNRLDRNIEGAMGEIAVARAYGLPWTANADTKTFLQLLRQGRYLKDVADVEVKTTRYPTGHLIIEKVQAHSGKIKPSDPLILCRVSGQTVTLAGWAYAHEITSHLNSTYKTPCYELPNNNLHPMLDLETLKAWTWKENS